MRYTLEEIQDIYHLPLTTLIYRAQAAHHKFQDPSGVQLCTLKSIKTGACPEDCKYCPQSAHSDVGLEKEALLDTETILQMRLQPKKEGLLVSAWAPRGEGFHMESNLNHC